MAINLKNRGQKLTSVFRGAIDTLPLRWRARLGFVKTTQKTPLSVEPDRIGGPIIASQVTQELTDERLKTDTKLGSDPRSETMIEYVRTKDGQVGTREVRLVPTGSELPTFTELTIDAGQEAFGNGWSEQMVVTVPNLFGANDYSVELRDVIPQEFAALLKTYEEAVTIPGTAMMPTLLTGDLRREEQQVTEQTKRVSRRYRDIASLPVIIIDHDTNREKQDVTIKKTLQLDSVPPLVPTAVKDTKYDLLGNGMAIQTESYTTAVFVGAVYETSIVNLIPERFRAFIESHVHEYTETGLVNTDPPLATGELARRESQTDEFNKRIAISSIDTTVVPQQLVSKDTNRDKQVVTITDILDLDSVAPPLPTAVRDVKFQPLGNGLAVTTLTTIDAVFVGAVYSKSIENLIPQKLRAAIPTRTHDFTVQNSAVVPDPTLASGELSHKETQIDEFNKRVESVSIDTVSGVTVSDKLVITEYGGSIATRTATLATHGTLSVSTGPRILKSELTDLNNGWDVLETVQADDVTWTALHGQDYDERFDVIIPYTVQTKDADADLGDLHTEIKPLDKWRETARSIDLTAVAAFLDTYSLKYFGKTNVDLPDKLVGLSAQKSSNNVTGSSTEDGTYSPSAGGNYSVQQSLKASAQSSASVLIEVTADIKQFWGNNVKCTNVHFFLPSPVVPTDVTTKLTALLGTAVIDWPKFNPQTVTLLIESGRVSVQVSASSQGSYSTNSSGSSSTAGGGVGWSKEVGLSLKSMRISPTIHGALTVSGDTNHTETVSADATAEAVGLGPNETHTETEDTGASVTPTSIAATTGATSWPTTGLYLFRVDAQPYRFGYIQFHCVVVDAADFPST